MAPLAGSPKFHAHPVIVPEAAGIVDEVLLKLTRLFSQLIGETVNLAEALSKTVIVFESESIQPPAVEVKVYLMV